MHIVEHVPAVAPTSASTEVDLDPDLDVEHTQRVDQPWVTIVWNDPVNLMSYVSWVFQNYFGYSQSKAEKLMMAVHSDGKAAVSHGPRERMETDTEAMHGYGLWATFEKDA